MPPLREMKPTPSAREAARADLGALPPDLEVRERKAGADTLCRTAGDFFRAGGMERNPADGVAVRAIMLKLARPRS